MGQAGGQGKEEDRPGPGQAGTHYDTGGLKADLRQFNEHNEFPCFLFSSFCWAKGNMGQSDVV